MSRHTPALAVVKTDEKPADRSESVPKTVKAAAEHSERALLVALRTRIATDIDAGVPPHTLAPLSKQIRELDREIRTIDAAAAEEAERVDNQGEAADEPFDAEAL